MRRFQLIEIEDQRWCPAFVRDALTDYLRWMMDRFSPYAVAAPILAQALGALGETEIVDLCAGGGGPWGDLLPRIAAAGRPAVRVRLTDYYPNTAAFARLRAASGDAIVGDPEPVDATRVPVRLTGFRTLFTALHHFPPAAAHAILADAVRSRRGIAVFELTRRSPLALVGMLFLPLLLLLCTPFIRPFRWSRLFWTYLVPIVPLVVWFDATVSCLRTYTADELRELTADLGEGYKWDVGAVRAPPLISRVTYVVGLPVASGL